MKVYDPTEEEKRSANVTGPSFLPPEYVARFTSVGSNVLFFVLFTDLPEMLEEQSLNDVEQKLFWIIIPFVLWVVPYLDKVASLKSLLSHTKLVGIPGWIVAGREFSP